MKHAASILAAALTLIAVTSLRADPIYPQVTDTSHATPQAATFFKSYFTAKSEHKPVPTTDHFSEGHLTYIDAALGWPFYSKKGMTDLFEQYMPKWPPTGLSYPTRISGDTHSALVAFTDTPPDTVARARSADGAERRTTASSRPRCRSITSGPTRWRTAPRSSSTASRPIPRRPLPRPRQAPG